jgi:hypothetical protein
MCIFLAADGDELYNVPSDAAYEQIRVAYILPFFKNQFHLSYICY